MPRLIRIATAVIVAGGLAVMVLSAQDDLDTVRQAAEQGDAEAQYNLGVICNNGEGVPQDDAEAVRWFRLAAEQGYAKAQVELGYRYRWGLGVPSDDAEAGRWLRLAAEQGHAKAQIEMALSYSQDDAEAVRWVRLAADQGDAEAQYNLGSRLYANGQGHRVLKDNTEAVKWYRLAADQGFARSSSRSSKTLGIMYAVAQFGQGVSSRTMPKWYRLAAEQGDASAQFNLGIMYANGQGVLKDDAEAMRWYRLAAEQGDAVRSSTSGSCTPMGRESSRTMPKP